MKLLLISLLFPLIGLGQKEYKITSVDSIKGQTVFFTCFYEIDTISGFIRFRGMGKPPLLIGRTIKFYKYGYGRRKIYFLLAN